MSCFARTEFLQHFAITSFLSERRDVYILLSPRAGDGWFKWTGLAVVGLMGCYCYECFLPSGFLRLGTLCGYQ